MTKIFKKILSNLQSRVKDNYTSVGDWIKNAHQPHSINATKAINREIQNFINQSIGKPLSSLTPVSKYFKTINGCKVELFFWKEGKDGGKSVASKIEQYAHLCFAWICMVLECHGAKIPRTMKCKFLLFNDKRYFPTNPNALVDKYNCNGGVTYLGQQDVDICVFRQEELFKVFIHETFHALGLHGPRINSVEGSKLAKLNTPCNIEYIEVYTEVWARILNSVFVSVVCPPYDNIIFILSREKEHGWEQCKCVLERSSLNQHRLKREGQPTPALEYYCFAGSIIDMWPDFINWCYKHNTPCDDPLQKKKKKKETYVIGFNLKNPKGWLEILGKFVHVGLIRAANEISASDKLTLEHCSGKTARMTLNDPFCI